ncbi:hypothetical protein BDW66DRAFT_146472 [Aspergillus desertorum]
MPLKIGQERSIPPPNGADMKWTTFCLASLLGLAAARSKAQIGLPSTRSQAGGLAIRNTGSSAHLRTSNWRSSSMR